MGMSFLSFFLAALGLRFCARAFSSCGERGPLFIVVRGPFPVAASLVAEHRLQTRRLSSCGSWAHLLRGMWDLPGPGLEPVSPALAGRFSTTAPPGKPSWEFLIDLQSNMVHLRTGKRERQWTPFPAWTLGSRSLAWRTPCPGHWGGRAREAGSQLFQSTRLP